MHTLLVYSRQYCRLCDDMIDALRLFESELDYAIKVYDIDDDVSLLKQFNALVPLVYFNGQELMRYYFEPATLKAALAQAD